VAVRSPTLYRRELASRLRELRKLTGLTVDDVAHELLCSPPKISRIETGTRSPTLRDVRDLCVLYRVDDTERVRLITMAREAKQQGWWNKFDDLAIDSLVGLEIKANRISSYVSCIVPWAFDAGVHPGLDNTFTLLEFDSSVQPPVAYVENLAGTFYLERKSEIICYREVLEHLRACALSPANSAQVRARNEKRRVRRFPQFLKLIQRIRAV
jgi:transcriptional regulator with XRE-family HTH domain